MCALRLWSAAIVICAVGVFARETSASLLVRYMSLHQMCDAAGRIFRGTVVGTTEGAVAAGGGQFRTVVYRLRVEEVFKGSFERIKGERVATLQMLQRRKLPERGSLRYVGGLDGPPAFQEGHDYLILATTPSRIGLSTTVGLQQGVFKLAGKAGEETAVNGNDNAGLSIMQSPSAAPGPVTYAALRRSIRQILGR